MVYISSQAITAAGRQGVMQAQADLARTQKELSSGTMADVGLGLGSTAGQFVSLSQQQTRLQAILDSNATTSTRLNSTATALTSLQTAAGNFLSSLTVASSTGSAIGGLQSTAQGSLATLISTLNTTVAGQAIFGGINTGAPPMSGYLSTPASASKTAVDAAFSSAFGTTQTSPAAAAIGSGAIQSFLDGPFAALFTGAAYAATWSSASDETITSQISATERAQTSVSANNPAFQKLAQAYAMVGEFAGQNLGPDATKTVIASAARLVSSAISDLTNTQAGVGVAQSSVAAANDGMTAQIGLLTQQSSALDGIDPYALSTRVSTLQTQIEASYEMTSKLQSMSLVNYLA